MKTKFALLTILLLMGCSENVSKDEQKTAEGSHVSSPSNRVAIPSSVRSNLGITFVTVERRQLKDTLRAPGRFEYLPSAKKEYRTMLSGRVEILVNQFDNVVQGQTLFRITSPEWREIQQNIAELKSIVQQLDAKMEMYNPLFLAHEQHEYSVKDSVKMWEERIQKLESLRDSTGGSSREFTAAKAAYSAARAELADLREKDVQLEASYKETIASLRAAKTKLDFSLQSASSILDIVIPSDNSDWWKEMSAIEIVSANSGVVESLNVTNGAWADEKMNVITVVQPDKLRFRASGLQSDLGALRNGLQVNIVPPTPTSSGNAVELQNTMRGTLQLGLSGNANDRTIDLYVTPENLSSWARPGVTAQLEIVIDSTSTSELAIPLTAVQQDGLSQVIFRRDPNNPNEAIRIEADLGLNDGRWVAVLSGLRDGDEVVLDGGFQLMLATSGSIQKGGHFHSDGTYHEGED